jgi:uncharacterized protein YndB with AHSA1/START domain
VNTPAAGEPLIVERYMKAPPSTVYSLLTRLDRWLAWQEPGASVDARPGGAFRMRVAGRAWASGHFVELVPDRRLVVNWQWESGEFFTTTRHQSSQVEIELIPEGAGTLVRLTHSGLLETEHDAHRQGWTFHLEQLAALTTIR